MYLVTGAAGFIGSHVTVALVRLGKRVRAFDNCITGTWDNLSEVADAVEMVTADVRDADAVRRALAGVEGVFHQAALRSVPRSVDDPLSTNDVNVTGTLQLLMAARDSGTVRRVVYASSSSVYGADETLPKREDQPTVPVSPYAASKLAAEHYCRIFARLYGLETTSLRYFNVFGPRQDPRSKYAAVVPRFIQAALRDDVLEVHGDGTQSRDFTYVDNVVAANLLAMETQEAAGQVINVACGERQSVLDIVAVLSRLLGRRLRTDHTPPRSGDVRHTLADISRARRLGYSVQVGFEEGLRRTLEYFAARDGSPRTGRNS